MERRIDHKRDVALERHAGTTNRDLDSPPLRWIAALELLDEVLIPET